MPDRLRHPCNYPGCSALTHERYCAAHQQVEQKRYNQEHPVDDAYYQSVAWRRLRTAYARSHPYCVDPYGDHKRAGQQVPMTVVDHKVPRQQGGKDTWDNLQALCRPCHARKSIEEGSRWGVKGVGV